MRFVRTGERSVRVIHETWRAAKSFVGMQECPYCGAHVNSLTRSKRIHIEWHDWLDERLDWVPEEPEEVAEMAPEPGSGIGNGWVFEPDEERMELEA